MESYKEKLPLGKWLIFTVLVALSTGCKPSFLMVFAPVMAIMLLIDWIVLILLILLLFVSSILIGYFLLLILERLIGCIGVVILGVVIVLVLLF